MTKTLLSFLLLTYACTVAAQDFETKEWNAANTNKPLIFYLSGDGGFNKFSTSLCSGLQEKGFDVIALNCRSYFWERKTPQEASDAIDNLLKQKMINRQSQEIVFIGYSFGADVLPFILTRVSKTINDKILLSYMIASSGSTDFEIHWSDILGGHGKRQMDVINELNKITNKKFIIIKASDDNDLDTNRITIKYKSDTLPGGHHFDGNTNEIIKTIEDEMS